VKIAGQGVAVKTPLATRINDLIQARGLSQAQAGQILKMPQPKVSAIRNYKLRGISLERLLEALADLGQDVEIVIRQPAPGNVAGIRVPV
jgi:predicted XRE-type DNA-binding protein